MRTDHAGRAGLGQREITVANPRPGTTRPGSERLPGGTRPLRAAEITAIGAGRRLYRVEIIGADATVNTILRYKGSLEPGEIEALSKIGERSFGICARAGVLYQQAADLLLELREQ
jgi:hypothetical protein